MTLKLNSVRDYWAGTSDHPLLSHSHAPLRANKKYDEGDWYLLVSILYFLRQRDCVHDHRFGVAVFNSPIAREHTTAQTIRDAVRNGWSFTSKLSASPVSCSLYCYCLFCRLLGVDFGWYVNSQSPTTVINADTIMQKDISLVNWRWEYQRHRSSSQLGMSSGSLPSEFDSPSSPVE